MSVTKAQLANLLVRTASYLNPKDFEDQKELYIEIIKTLEPDTQDKYILSVLNEEEYYNPIFDDADFGEVDFSKASVILEFFEFVISYGFNKEQFLAIYLYALSKSEILSVENILKNMKEIAKGTHYSRDTINILWKNLTEK